MASTVTVHSPYVFTPDLVSLKEASALFDETGPGHQVSAQTLKRWAVKHGITVERVDGKDYASWTDLQEIHRDEIDRRERRARR